MKLNCWGMAADEEDTVVLAGHTVSSNFPVTPEAYDSSVNSTGEQMDVFVVRLRCDSSLTPQDQLVYGTFLGGAADEAPTGLAVDSTGAIFVTGYTWSFGFPTTPVAANRRLRGRNDAFLSRLDPSRTGAAQLTYSTLLGAGDLDVPRGIALLDDGRACVTGWTTSWDFPCVRACVNENLQGQHDTVLAVVDTQASGPESLQYSSLLGGTDSDVTLGNPGVDLHGVLRVHGTTSSVDFPVDSQAFQRELGGQNDLFVAACDFTQFLRGDCNSDGTVDVADASCTLNWLFSSGDEPGCVAATNANGDDDVDLADAVYVLNYLFGGGPAPAQPFAECGPRSVEADFELGCETPPASCR